MFAQISALNEHKRQFKDISADTTCLTSDSSHDEEEWLPTVINDNNNKTKRSKTTSMCKSDAIKEGPTSDLSGRPFYQAEIKMVEVLSFVGTLFRHLNNLDFESFEILMHRSIVPECTIKTYWSPDTLPRTIIPRDSFCGFVQKLSDAIPDALWAVQNTKLRIGKPRTVISNFHRSGIPTA